LLCLEAGITAFHLHAADVRADDDGRRGCEWHREASHDVWRPTGRDRAHLCIGCRSHNGGTAVWDVAERSITFVAVPLVLALVVAAATWLAAPRAAQLEPMIALRSD
jgi:hypothetical protein